MKKIISLFKRNYDGDFLVYNEVVPGAEWVIDGKGVATEKADGTAAAIIDGKYYKRYDRKLTKSAFKRKKAGHKGPWQIKDFKPKPEGWINCEAKPDQVTGHWPGWIPVNMNKDYYFVEALERYKEKYRKMPPNGTYEVIGPRVNANPYKLSSHEIKRHKDLVLVDFPPRDFDGIKEWLGEHELEGIVWHWEDKMVKIKRRDFGLKWPIKQY